MEFHERLQELRKQRGLTQEELAASIYVSRTAISKWESGRGYPNIDSLKALSGFFAVTIDELLSGEEVLAIAENDQKEQKTRLIFNLLDCSVVIFFFLPIFGQTSNGILMSVPLPALREISPWLKVSYFVITAAMLTWGILGFTGAFKKYRSRISLLLNTAGAFLFILSSKPYAAAILFVFLAIKMLFIIKKH